MLWMLEGVMGSPSGIPTDKLGWDTGGVVEEVLPLLLRLTLLADGEMRLDEGAETEAGCDGAGDEAAVIAGGGEGAEDGFVVVAVLSCGGCATHHWHVHSPSSGSEASP
jgi:hypothetical protein